MKCAFNIYKGYLRNCEKIFHILSKEYFVYVNECRVDFYHGLHLRHKLHPSSSFGFNSWIGISNIVTIDWGNPGIDQSISPNDHFKEKYSIMIVKKYPWPFSKAKIKSDAEKVDVVTERDFSAGLWAFVKHIKTKLVSAEATAF